MYFGGSRWRLRTLKTLIMVAIMLQKSSQIEPANVKNCRSSEVKVEMGAWMLDAGTWKLKP